MPNPVVIFDALNSHIRTSAFKAAIELEVFTAIGEGAATVDAIAARCNASPRGVRILCDFLVIHGLLAKDGGSYANTEEAALFLDKRSPAYFGDAHKFLTSDLILSAFRDLTTTVKTGRTTLDREGTMAYDHPVWVEFARSMVNLVRPAAGGTAALVAATGGAKKVLDIAAGHGMFGILVAKSCPGAEVVAVDWPNVLEVAKENAATHGIAAYRTLPGSAFDVDFGEGYDVALVTNFYHHFDRDTCIKLARRMHAALAPGGRMMTVDFVPNADRVTPPAAAGFSMMMLGTTEAGDAYTFAEYQDMFEAAGFARNELHELENAPQQVIASTK